VTARITINLTGQGELEIWLNEEGRDLLVRELQQLSEHSDHFHFGPAPAGEVEVSSVPYRSGDQILEYGKVYFRTEAWDREHFPHVLNKATDPKLEQC
jgi:hypothetical protein